MEIREYIEERVNGQIKWYSEKSQRAQKNYKNFQTAEIVMASLIPLLSGYVSKHAIIPFVVGLLGVAIATIESITKLNKYHENWIQYRTTCELLKYHKHLYLTHTHPYNDSEGTIENIFVQNIEDIISSENNQWKAINVANEESHKSENQSSTNS